MTNLTNEKIQAILDGAPEEFTHIDLDDGEYEVYGDGTRNLSDLREILTLRQEVGRLKAQQSEVAARAVKHGFRCAVALQNNPDVKPLGIDVYANRVANLYVKTMNLFKEQGDE